MIQKNYNNGTNNIIHDFQTINSNEMIVILLIFPETNIIIFSHL